MVIGGDPRADSLPGWGLERMHDTRIHTSRIARNVRLPCCRGHPTSLAVVHADSDVTAIPASCGKAVPAGFKWLPLDFFHLLGSFRALVQRAPSTFWLHWVAGVCADQGMPGSHVDGSRRDARDQEAQDALHYGGRKPGSGRPKLRSGSAPARASYNCSQLWRIRSQIAPRIFSHRDA